MALGEENYARLGALSELREVEGQIWVLQGVMARAQLDWVFQDPVPGHPDRVFFRLRPEYDEQECRRQWAEWQAQMRVLEARKLELERALNPQNEREVSHA